MQMINDAISFLKSLAFFDILFFLSVLSLMLLIVALIYFIKENNSSEILSELPKLKEEKNDASISEALIKVENEIQELKEISEALENAEPNVINLNKYEEEQEEKAIISYEELLKHKNDFAINYSEEENIDEELTIKKVDLDNLLNKEVIETPKLNVTVISYEKEEAFLEALKTLQRNLS